MKIPMTYTGDEFEKIKQELHWLKERIMEGRKKSSVCEETMQKLQNLFNEITDIIFSDTQTVNDEKIAIIDTKLENLKSYVFRAADDGPVANSISIIKMQYMIYAHHLMQHRVQDMEQALTNKEDILYRILKTLSPDTEMYKETRAKHIELLNLLEDLNINITEHKYTQGLSMNKDTKAENNKSEIEFVPELAEKFLSGHLIVKIENQEQLDALIALAKRTDEELAYWCVTAYEERYPYISCSPNRGKVQLDAQSLCLYEDRTFPFSEILHQNK